MDVYGSRQPIPVARAPPYGHFHDASGPRSVDVHGYRTLLAQGTLYTGAVQLANVAAVLPFLCTELGHHWLAAVLYPIYGFGVIGGYTIGPVVLHWSRHLRHLVFACAAMTMAVLFAIDAVAADTRHAVSVTFFLTAIALGVARGITELTHTELVSDKMPPKRQHRVILGQYIGAAAAVGAAELLTPALPGAQSDLMLLWLGAAGLFAAATAALFVGPVMNPAAMQTVTLSSTVRDGMRLARTSKWYRGYLTTQQLFVPITLGVTFYTLHMSTHGGGTPVGLRTVVVWSSAGLFVGSFVWSRTAGLAGVRGMLLLSSLLAVGAAGLCMSAQVAGLWSYAWIHGIVFMIAAMANQAVYVSGVSWVNLFAAEQGRATMRGFAQALTTLITSLAGPLFGMLAAHGDAMWSVATVMALCVGAVAAATRAPARRTPASSAARRRLADAAQAPAWVR